MYSLEEVICQEFWMCSRSSQHIESVLRLWYQLWPQNEREVGMAGAKPCDEVALIRADRSLHCIRSMVVRFNELDSQLALLSQKLYNRLHELAVLVVKSEKHQIESNVL